MVPQFTAAEQHGVRSAGWPSAHFAYHIYNAGEAVESGLQAPPRSSFSGVNFFSVKGIGALTKRIEKQLSYFPHGLDEDASYLYKNGSRPTTSSSSAASSRDEPSDEFIMRNAVVHRYYEKDLLSYASSTMRLEGPTDLPAAHIA